MSAACDQHVSEYCIYAGKVKEAITEKITTMLNKLDC